MDVPVPAPGGVPGPGGGVPWPRPAGPFQAGGALWPLTASPSCSTRGRYGEGAQQEKFTYALSLVFIQCVINAAFAKLRESGPGAPGGAPGACGAPSGCEPGCEPLSWAKVGFWGLWGWHGTGWWRSVLWHGQGWLPLSEALALLKGF